MALVGCSGAADEGVRGVDDVAAEGAPAPIDPSTHVPSTAKLATDVEITRVVAYQGVSVDVTPGHARGPADMGLVAERPTLVRAFVRPSANAAGAPHAIVGELHVVGPYGAERVLRQAAFVIEESRVGELASTINFELRQGELEQGSSYFVELVDEHAPEVPTRASNRAQLPSDGSAASLSVRSATTLNIELVPVRYLGDGSGRLPDTSPAALERAKDKLFELYPVADVKLHVRDAVDFDRKLDPSETDGWVALRSTITRLRLDDDAAADVFYYGLVAPSATLADYCAADGCIAGLANPAKSPSDASVRAAVGAWWSDDVSAGTMAHELGHVHGRYHAPCGGANGADVDFPYAGGLIGSWGYSITRHELVTPGDHADMMGYCHPEWVSDYTFKALYDRLHFVATAGAMGETSPRRFSIVNAFERGALEWAGETTVRTSLSGEPVSAKARLSDGRTVDLDAHYYPMDHADAGTLFIESAPDAIAIELSGLPAKYPTTIRVGE